MTTDSQNTVRQQFDMGPNSELSVSNVSGSVSVHAEEGMTITVRAQKRGSSRSRDITDIDIRRDGNKVSVQTKTGQVGLMSFGRSSAIDYDISVPNDCSVRLNAVSSDVKIEGIRAEVGVQTVSGDLKLEDLAGELTATTVSGDIEGRSITGTLVVRTTSGDCELRRTRLRRFSINTVSGDFTVETPLISGEQCYAKTVSGDLSLIVPADTKATVHLKSISGSVGCELPAEIVKSGRRHWQGRINGGGAQLEMSSISGDLNIKRGAGSVPNVPETPEYTRSEHREEPGAYRPSEEQVSTSEQPGVGDVDPAGTAGYASTAEVLAALERGELSVDEAMARLDELQLESAPSER
jgi:DUF4097 and DUF4098 domain-containing protein YvlB